MSIFGFDMANNYEQRVIDRTEFDGSAVVDTAAVSDGSQPYETAIMSPAYNRGRWMIVEAYDTPETAQKGHNKWVGIMSADKLPDQLVEVPNAAIAEIGKAVFGNGWLTHRRTDKGDKDEAR